MMTEEEVAQVIAYCDENKISYKQRLSELGINPWNFYDAKRKYAPKEEGEDSGAFFLKDISAILILRALLGVSVGMIMPLSTGLLSYYFPPEDQSRLMGLCAAMNQIGGVIATLIAGVLAKVGWNYAFLVYSMGLFCPDSCSVVPAQ